MKGDKIEILKKIEEIIKRAIQSNTRLNRDQKINDIIDNSWCEYSDLPSPMWYKNKKETD